MAPHPLRRLAASGMAYQSAGLVAGVLAIVTLPLYTRHLTRDELGAAETLLTWIILASILLRAGLQEALLRHWFHDDDPDRRARLARRVTGWVLLTSTVLSVVVLVLAEPLSRLVLGESLPGPIRATALGIWAFTNLEILNALLRAQEARRTYLVSALCNVALTVGTTIVLVVVLDQGASGYLLGNYAASTAVLAGLWWSQRGLLGRRTTGAGGRSSGVDAGRVDGAGGDGDAPRGSDSDSASTEDRDSLRSLLRFGLPTVPPEAAVFALNLIDRQWLVHSDGLAENGVYSAAGKLATLVIVVARAFQAAWPPLAYELSDEEAPRTYANVVRAYVLVLGWMIVGLVLLRFQVTDLLLGPEFASAAGALPWLALGWALWGLTWVFTTIAGRHHATGRTLPSALLGLAVNVAALAVLVPPLGATGAAIALVAAYVVALGSAHLRTRRLMHVPFEWGRLAAAVVALTVLGAGLDWVAAPDGAGGILLRLAGCAAAPALLLAVGAVKPSEAQLVRRAIASRLPGR
ncbi:lipopolysaccharide biosynthesis protein [Patulibacter minatonensis]|uniref:lipopolysaccharide biosynthesis protein n=1 Tax=Patulibacter minatonensis TaxID=298163 RepID=UPI00047EC874|nr:lipopolysaccharide biosynthesis protein [Patulibacter minatonensis]